MHALILGKHISPCGDVSGISSLPTRAGVKHKKYLMAVCIMISEDSYTRQWVVNGGEKAHISVSTDKRTKSSATSKWNKEVLFIRQMCFDALNYIE